MVFGENRRLLINLGLIKTKFLKGEKNPAWNGGSSKLRQYPKEFYDIRNFILWRDKYQCFLCKNEEHLAVHHINHNIFDNYKNNLITLCVRCNFLEIWKRKDYQPQFENYLKNLIILENYPEIIRDVMINISPYGKYLKPIE